MEWSKSLKRTRNGSIYSETTSSIGKIISNTCKRRKTIATNPNRDSEGSGLEALPTELLQQIFLNSMNGNLITASPVIAVKLSGQMVLYRAAFILAFYGHDIFKMFELHNLHSLIPMVSFSPSSWDVRSMTRAVLGSRWCTWGQVRLWLSDNLEYAAKQLLQKGTPAYSSGAHINKFMDGELQIEDLYGRCWSAEDEQKRHWSLETCAWDIRLARSSDIYQDEWQEEADDDEAYKQDPFTFEWKDELIFHCQMRIFGVLTIGEEKTQNETPGFHDHEPFRDVVEGFTGLSLDKIKPQPSSPDVYQLLEERAIRATRNAHWLRETLAIEYYLHPDGQSFKVPPRLYRSAAAADVKLETPVYYQRGAYVPVLHVLFAIDPLSLPRQDSVLLAWAARARRRVLAFFNGLQELREELGEQRFKRHGVLSTRDRNKYRALRLEHKHTYEVDLKILHYFETGWLESIPDPIAPNFTEPLQWLGEKLNPCLTALDEAEMVTYPNADPRDINIFAEDPDYENEDDQEAELVDDVVALFHRSELQIETEAELKLDRVGKAEARFALTAYDGYYRSWYHDGYQQLFPNSQGGADGNWHSDNDEEEWETDESEDEEEANADDHDKHDEPANIHYGEEQREDPFGLPHYAMALDWIVMRPDKDLPIPPLVKDTVWVDAPFMPRPEWFRPAEKPYIQELRQAKSKKTIRRGRV